MFDLIVVGGGINGTGIARDAAMRGLKTLLVEKGDFSAGTSGSSSQMIHGGLRYLLSNVSTTKLACQDSGYIQQIASHLIFRIPFIFPVYAEGMSVAKARLKLEAVETFIELYDRYSPLKRGKPHSRLTPAEVIQLEPSLVQENLVGAVTFDEWGIDVPRLCIANALSARAYGADVRNHTQVTEVLRDAHGLTGIRTRDLLTGEENVFQSKMVVNATGPWSPQFGKMAGVDILLRPGKGIHITFERRLFNMAVTATTIDNREVFILPYENVSILGTTDDDFFGDLDDQRVLEEEVAYLIEAVGRVFPSVKTARILRTWSGVRPTLYERGPDEDDLSREHLVVDHELKDGVKGLVSILGGKLASYRIMAQETTDVVCQKLGNTKPCRTHLEPLPGADEMPDLAKLAQEYELDPYTVSRIAYRQGSKINKVLDPCKKNPHLKQIVCACEPVIAAEVLMSVKEEGARTLSDVRRRTRLGLGPCQGMQCLLSCGNFLGESCDFSINSLNAQMLNYLQNNWPNRQVALRGNQLVQEELARHQHFGVNCLDKSDRS